MKPFLNKDLPSFLYVMSILLFGCFLAVIIDDKTISKRNKTLNE